MLISLILLLSFLIMLCLLLEGALSIVAIVAAVIEGGGIRLGLEKYLVVMDVEMTEVSAGSSIVSSCFSLGNIESVCCCFLISFISTISFFLTNFVVVI